MGNKLQFFLTKIKEVFKFGTKIKFATIPHNEHLLIYGISRGGTTLLAETLTGILDARLIWEPFFNYTKAPLATINPYATETYRALALGWYPHVAAMDDQEANAYFDDYFALKKRNIRFFRHTNSQNFKKSQWTVHKMCFGDFMYGYLQKRYGLKSILLFRHPFAIAASSLNFGSNYEYHKNNYAQWSFKGSRKSGTFFDRYEDKYHLVVSGFTLLVFQTVCQFVYLLEHFDRNNSAVIFYEHLVIDKKRPHQQLETLLGRPMDYKAFESLLNRQSFSSSIDHTEADALAQLSKWKKGMDDDDISAGLKIFEAFNFDIYSEDILPDTTSYDALVAGSEKI